MARMTCQCGMPLDNHEAPNDVELIVYTDREWDRICTPDVIHPWEIPLPQYNVWRCPGCKRIHVYDGYGKPVMVYRLEDEA